MPNRAERRAAERSKLNEPVGVQAAAEASIQSPEESSHLSAARAAANRANAQLTRGPRTEAGKFISSLNVVKTRLTGRTVLLTTDDTAIYQQHIARHFSKLEAGIFASDRLKLADQFASHEDANTREALLLNEIYTVYRKDLNNLALQERRLRNQQKSDMADLRALQDERRAQAEKVSYARFRQVSEAVSLVSNARSYVSNARSYVSNPLL